MQLEVEEGFCSRDGRIGSCTLDAGCCNMSSFANWEDRSRAKGKKMIVTRRKLRREYNVVAFALGKDLHPLCWLEGRQAYFFSLVSDRFYSQGASSAGIDYLLMIVRSTAVLLTRSFTPSATPPTISALYQTRHHPHPLNPNLVPVRLVGKDPNGPYSPDFLPSFRPVPFVPLCLPLWAGFPPSTI
ncbi:hypothetical protein GJ744_009310 [Endocarpon pusillum]|uniref:Uncharacterized protein n=1 Tax=Endocarpon pusillum TaxID=364733 RepID=A0A8H7AHP9_9EURO|nr:hypothetical protein GJ744_009310 [Endocarpon pusillum]